MKWTIFVIDCNMYSSKMLGYDIDDLMFSGSTYLATAAEALLYHIFMVIERKICDKWLALVYEMKNIVSLSKMLLHMVMVCEPSYFFK